MILKYKTPKSERKWFNKKVIYCRVFAKEKMANGLEAYVVKMLNFHNNTSIYLSSDLCKLNLLDRLKCVWILLLQKIFKKF